MVSQPELLDNATYALNPVMVPLGTGPMSIITRPNVPSKDPLAVMPVTANMDPEPPTSGHLQVNVSLGRLTRSLLDPKACIITQWLSGTKIRVLKFGEKRAPLQYTVALATYTKRNK